MAKEHKENWGGKFGTMMQAVVDEFQAGQHDAFSAFFYVESTRVLGHLPMLSCPGADESQ